MANADKLATWVDLTAVTLLLCYLLSVGVGALRRLRLGKSGVEVAAWLTVALTGTGIAIAAAFGGSRLAHVIARFLVVTPVLGIWLQVAGALFFSEIAHRIFGRWFARPLSSWFRGEEAEQLGG